MSLVPSVTESLFDLQVGHTLVGCTDYCVHPAERVAALPKIGGTKNPDIEKIKALRPDLVIANQEENRPADVATLQQAGVPVWVMFPCSVREAIDGLWAIIRLFNVPLQGQTLVILEKTYEWTSRAAANAPQVRVFCPIWREPWMTFNQATYMHDLLLACGALNVFGDRQRQYPLAADLGLQSATTPRFEADTRYPRVTLAEVAERAPDVILLPSEPYAFSLEDAQAFAAYAQMPAVARQQIVTVDGSLLTWHGTRLARALAELPALLAAFAT